MQECILCKSIENMTMKNVIIENEHAMAIAEGYFREGHCTVILKEHKRSISELEEGEHAAIFELVSGVSRALEKKYDVEKTYLLAIGDKVEHLHFHLIPKHKNKCSMGVYCFGKLFEAEGENRPSEADLKTLKNELRQIIERP